MNIIDQTIAVEDAETLYRWADQRNDRRYAIRPGARDGFVRIYVITSAGVATFFRSMRSDVFASEFSQTPRAATMTTPKGWSRYSRPQGTCQYCGAPCSDTPSPTCDDC